MRRSSSLKCNKRLLPTHFKTQLISLWKVERDTRIKKLEVRAVRLATGKHDYSYQSQHEAVAGIRRCSARLKMALPMTRASHHFMIPLRSWFGNIIDRNVVVEGIFSSAPQAGGWASLKEISRVLIVTVVNTPIKVVLFRILPEVYSPADRQNIYLFYLCQGCFSFTIQCILGGLFLKFVFIYVNFSWRKWRKTTAFCLSKKRETLLSYHYFFVEDESEL